MNRNNFAHYPDPDGTIEPELGPEHVPSTQPDQPEPDRQHLVETVRAMKELCP